MEDSRALQDAGFCPHAAISNHPRQRPPASRLDAEAETTKLTISGNAAVGKTRTVLEALTEGNDASGLVFYSDDEDRAIELTQNLKNNPEVFAVIIADECMETAAFRIGRALEGFEQRSRLHDNDSDGILS